MFQPGDQAKDVSETRRIEKRRRSVPFRQTKSHRCRAIAPVVRPRRRPRSVPPNFKPAAEHREKIKVPTAPQKKIESPSAALEKNKPEAEQRKAMMVSTALLDAKLSEILSNPERRILKEMNKKNKNKLVYYFGQKARKGKRPPDRADADDNSWLDDENGNYRIRIGEHIRFQYEVLGSYGKGGFSSVLKAWDHKNNQTVALKVIRAVPEYIPLAMREIHILKEVRRSLLTTSQLESANLLLMYEYFVYRSHLIYALEPLGISLLKVLQRTNYEGLDIGTVQSLATDIFRGLTHLESIGLVHADLKPENILLTGTNERRCKIADLGSAFFLTEVQDSKNAGKGTSTHLHKQIAAAIKPATATTTAAYLQSRFYRSPEVVLGGKRTSAMDVFSAGCLLAEMFAGQPIFQSDDNFDQLSCTMELLGRIPPSFLATCRKEEVQKCFDANGEPKYCQVKTSKTTKAFKGITFSPEHKEPRGLPGSRTWREALKLGKNEDVSQFVKFLQKCLELDPDCRTTASEALAEEPFLNPRKD